jgi:anti-sigma-K factor RskA
MTNKDHSYVSELLAAYAAHAVDDDEKVVVESHVEHCDECQIELDSYNATAGLLGSSAASPPEGVWERIIGQIEATDAPPMNIESARRKQEGRDLGAPRRLIAVAAAFIVLAAGFGVFRAESNHNNSTSELAMAKAAAKSPGSKSISLDDSSKSMRVNVMLAANGVGYIEGGTLPVLPAGRTYQLWVFKGTNTAISVGMLGQSIHAMPFAPGPGVTALAITVERAGGAQTPTSAPMVTATVSA